MTDAMDLSTASTAEMSAKRTAPRRAIETDRTMMVDAVDDKKKPDDKGPKKK